MPELNELRVDPKGAACSAEDALRHEIEQHRGLIGHLKKFARDSALDTARAVLKTDDHPAGIVGRNMKVLYVNQSFSTFLGYAPDDIVGQRYTVLLEGSSTDIYAFFKAEAEVVRQRVDVLSKAGVSKRYELTKTVVRLPVANYFFTVFHMHPPGFQDSLSLPDERRALERFLEQRAHDRRQNAVAESSIAEEKVLTSRREEVLARIRRAHALADKLLSRY